MSELRSFWESHYRTVYAQGESWLDYSNRRVQLQTLGLVLEVSDVGPRDRCLDVGCGRGQFSRCLSAFGAEKIMAIDFSADVIAELSKRCPQIDWRCGNLLDQGYIEALGKFERVFALEVLQCVPFEQTLRRLWDAVAPGGRLLAVTPNGSCPIVTKTMQRFEGTFNAPTPSTLRGYVSKLPELASWSARALFFADDQRLAPYEVSGWDGACEWSRTPNRIQWVAFKRESV